MTNQLTPTEIKIPEALEFIFSFPPLIGKEQRKEYEKLLQAVACELRPDSLIEWMLLGDYVYYSWVIRRDRLILTGIVEEAQRRYLSFGPRMTWEEFELKYQERVGKAASGGALSKQTLKKPPEDSFGALAKAYAIGNDEIEAVDRRLSSYESRRNLAFREMQWVSEFFARKAKKVTEDVVDAEFTETAE